MSINGAWDSSNVGNSNVTFSNGDKTATSNSSGGFGLANGTDAHGTGKYYFEVTASTVVSPGSEGWQCGFSNQAGSIGASIDDSGAIGGFAGGSATGTGFSSGAVIGVAVDIGGGKYWFRTGAGNWNGSGTANPATGVGGLSFTAGTTVIPFFQALFQSGDVATLNTGTSAFANAAPSGFSAWFAGSGGVNTPKALSSTLTTSAALLKSAGKKLSATLTSTATLAKAVAKKLSATLTSTATLRKAVAKTLLATITSAASIAAGRGHFLTLTATLTTGASLAKGVGKSLAATVTSTASLNKNAGKTLSATLTSSAIMSKGVGKRLAAALATSASLSRAVAKPLAVTLTTTATLARATAKNLTATLATTASLATSTGTVVVQAIKDVVPRLINVGRMLGR